MALLNGSLLGCLYTLYVISQFSHSIEEMFGNVVGLPRSVVQMCHLHVVTQRVILTVLTKKFIFHSASLCS